MTLDRGRGGGGFRRYGTEDADVELEEAFIDGQVDGEVWRGRRFEGVLCGDVVREE